ncbi:MAG: 3-methyl-2-oxobutanoate hydroxymethyltransferase [Planctomycetota bacterium]|nr:3-methyl-2-oxobutanoate hydroxymethyltransferase [Planctomycetota bacterium]
MSDSRKKHTVLTFAKAKEKSRKLAAVTAYDYPFASFAEKAGMDLILVGDSLGMVQLGYRGHPAGYHGPYDSSLQSRATGRAKHLHGR